ncbi:MAG: hypothetical protein QOK16_3509 [Solirubrobacteraceae bacterium]|nr:hypothetical protein [Solirubrobacteraceae bacterium]
MSGYVIGSLIGAGAVLLGSLLTGHREQRVRVAEREASRRAELKTAMREYLAALDAVTNELRDQLAQPTPTRVDRSLDRAMQRAGLQVVVFMIGRLLNRAVYGRRHEVLADELMVAAAHLRLVAPPAVADLMREVEEVALEYSSGDEQWQATWMLLRARVRAEFRSQLLEPYRT